MSERKLTHAAGLRDIFMQAIVVVVVPVSDFILGTNQGIFTRILLYVGCCHHAVTSSCWGYSKKVAASVVNERPASRFSVD
jgi:hypothetical protein